MSGQSGTPKRTVKCHAWRPQELYNRNRLTPQQYNAAQRLLAINNRAFGSSHARSPTRDKVDCSSLAGSHEAKTEAAAQWRAALAALTIPAVRAVVQHIVIVGGSARTAAELDEVDLPWMQKGGSRERETATLTLLGVGLEALAAHFAGVANGNI